MYVRIFFFKVQYHSCLRQFPAPRNDSSMLNNVGAQHFIGSQQGSTTWEQEAAHTQEHNMQIIHRDIKDGRRSKTFHICDSIIHGSTKLRVCCYVYTGSQYVEVQLQIRESPL